MLSASNLKVSYNERVVIKNLNLQIDKGEIVSIIGPNGSGKSTLLRTLAGMILPLEGGVFLEGENIQSIKSKKFSQRLCLLSQFNQVPNDITVEQLVYYGRIPHKKWYETRSSADDELVAWAIHETRLSKYKHTPIGLLSGGERQRVYIAQALCQKTDLLLLDEPTTYLDISFQLDLMELISEINERFGITIVMVLHELNQASRYSDRLVMMKDGRIVAEGKPTDVMTRARIRQVYGIECEIDCDLIWKRPRIYPVETIRNVDLLGEGF